MNPFQELDDQMVNACKDVKWFLRIGSSIHEEWFDNDSDIDYLIVMDDVSRSFINNFPGRTSPELPPKVASHNGDFYWRITTTPYKGHAVNVTIYSTIKFLGYCHARSPPKIYLLQEHILLLGSETDLVILREECTPNEQTAKQDLETLKNPRYATMWPWAWRSLSILQKGPWLKNKAEITAYVTKYYPGQLENKQYLIKKLEDALQRETP